MGGEMNIKEAINKMSDNGNANGLAYLMGVLKLVNAGERLTAEQEKEVDRCIKREQRQLTRDVIDKKSEEVRTLLFTFAIFIIAGILWGIIEEIVNSALVAAIISISFVAIVATFQSKNEKHQKKARVAFRQSELNDLVERYEKKKEYWH